MCSEFSINLGLSSCYACACLFCLLALQWYLRSFLCYPELNIYSYQSWSSIRSWHSLYQLLSPETLWSLKAKGREAQVCSLLHFILHHLDAMWQSSNVEHSWETLCPLYYIGFPPCHCSLVSWSLEVGNFPQFLSSPAGCLNPATFLQTVPSFKLL